MLCSPSNWVAPPQTTPHFLPEWPKRLERFKFWFRALLLLSLLLYHHVINLGWECGDLAFDIDKLIRGVLHMHSSIPYICSTLAMRRSRRSSPCACASEDGCVKPFEADVYLSISSFVSLTSSSILSLGIWEMPVFGPVMWALLLVTVWAPIR